MALCGDSERENLIHYIDKEIAFVEKHPFSGPIPQSMRLQLLYDVRSDLVSSANLVSS